MNVYDFDETIYIGDAEVHFFNFYFERFGSFPWKFIYLLFEFLPMIRVIGKTRAREIQYKLLKNIPDIDAFLEEFWERNEKNGMEWYKDAQRPDDVIASGTPEFILMPYIRKLGMEDRLVATDMDPYTGKVNGRFYVMEEKLAAFKRKFPGQKVDCFSSDSWSDHFFAEFAEHAYVVDRQRVRHEWNQYFAEHPEKRFLRYHL